MADVAAAPDWKPWGQPRLGDRGVETAFHHPLILVRKRGSGSIRAVAPDAALVGAEAADLEWSPMLWALRGRRERRTIWGLRPGSVLQGENDRLFLFGDASCEQIFEGGFLGPRGLTGWVETLRRRIDYCESRGVAYRHLVIPDSPAIYADAVPGAPKLRPDRPLTQILNAGGEKLGERLIYPLNALIDARATAETSLPHDVHLTGFGCFVCYRELVKKIPQVDPDRVVREEELRVRKVLIAGDLARTVEMPGRRVDFHEPPPVKFKTILKGTTYKGNQVDVWENEDSSLPKLVLFRTSNSTHLISFLIRHFSRIVAMASMTAHFDLIESEKPDVAISEHPERYLASLGLGVNETDRGSEPHDLHDAFEKISGHGLPLPTEFG